MTRQRKKGCVAWVSVEVSHSGPQGGTQVQAPKNEALTPPTCLPPRSLIISGFRIDPGAPQTSPLLAWPWPQKTLAALELPCRAQGWGRDALLFQWAAAPTPQTFLPSCSGKGPSIHLGRKVSLSCPRGEALSFPDFASCCTPLTKPRI